MHTPHPPRPSRPPRPGVVPGMSDESLAARLRGRPESGAGDPVAMLMARHWQSAHDYAAICLASSGDTASMVTAASFRRVLEGLALGESGIALRPRLLVTVRNLVKQWSAEEPLAGVLPDLRKPAGGRGMRAAQSLTPENRKLAERSFDALPALSQCLLWHTEVEAEPITVPAGLLGVGVDTASATLEQAREQFREGCVRAHRELAPSRDCRFYNRLLDVPIRRGGALLPDVQDHLVQCRYCRSAAEQLSHFESGLGSLLAEAVLGWGARRYVDSRPDRAPHGTGSRQGGRRVGSRRHRLLSRFPVRSGRGRAVARGGRALATGLGIASSAVLATVLSAALWSDGGDGANSMSTSAAGGHGTATDSGVLPSATSSPPPGSAGLPVAPGRTRLRNLAADLCLDVRGGAAQDGAAARLAACSTASTQQWSYEDDGQLRSVADPRLCLDSHVDAGVVVLGACAGTRSARVDDVRYDLTVRGELLPRRQDELALAPTTEEPEADVVVKVRDGSDAQRWVTDGTKATPGSLSISGTGGPSAAPEPAAPEPGAGTPLAGGGNGVRPEARPEARTGTPAPATPPGAVLDGTVRSAAAATGAAPLPG
ncbi:RICIN domain-containing protein [Streptomyces sp. CRN 30]|uniref:RICIN domain-containing protein n=1 Tax=Streptomyces sp. CRN 30 TaxID=3075613 RepID=UPI002A8230F7|nr:RICIN domain-containing protein [Streptomyces sp. CRN 30]